jgi:hypothetical protein
VKLSSHFENAPHPQTQKAGKKKPTTKTTTTKKSALHSPAQASKHRKIYRPMLVAAKLKTNQLRILPWEKPTKQKLKTERIGAPEVELPEKRSTPKKKNLMEFFFK